MAEALLSVNGLHTGYVLEALADSKPPSPSPAAEALSRGLAFYRRHLFDADGLPLDRVGGLPGRFETHAAAEALLVLSRFAAQDAAGRLALERLVTFVLTRMRGLDGLFADLWNGRAVRRMPHGYMRWTQAWMLRALAGAARAAS